MEHMSDFEIAVLDHMKTAHSGTLKAVVESGFVLTAEIEAMMHEIAETLTTGFYP
jgi:hypothetical protein